MESVSEGSRAVVGLELVKRELMNGIEGDDVVDDLLKVPRNAICTLIRGTQQIVPSVLNAASNQRFALVGRTHPLSGVTTSAGNIYRTAKKKNVLGTVSAIAFEGTDGLVDDALGLAGGAQYHVRALAA